MGLTHVKNDIRRVLGNVLASVAETEYENEQSLRRDLEDARRTIRNLTCELTAAKLDLEMIGEIADDDAITVIETNREATRLRRVVDFLEIELDRETRATDGLLDENARLRELLSRQLAAL